MSFKRVFETRLISDKNIKVELVTERLEGISVISFLKVRFTDDGIPKLFDRFCFTSGYIDNVERLFKNLSNWVPTIMYSLKSLCNNDYSKIFLSLMQSGVDEGIIQNKITEHNNKTQHKLHLLPRFKSDDIHTSLCIVDNVSDKINITINFNKTSSVMTTTVVGTIKGKSKTCTRDRSFSRPEDISNFVISSLTTLINTAINDLTVRMDLFADINEYFENGRFGIWDFLVRNK